MEEAKTPPKKRNLRRILKLAIALILGSFILGVSAFLFYFNWILKTPLSDSDKKVLFEVRSKESTKEVAEQLKRKGIIRSDFLFYIDAKFKGKSLMPGVYELSPNKTIVEILDTISSGNTKIVKVTIPEGYRVEQIAQVLDKNKLVAYSDFVKAAKPYEGKLFPDTYYLSPDNSIETIIKTMNDDYKERISGLNVTDEDLIIASIVEREAIKDQERPLIAGVYKNRIKVKMKLEADPTVQYGKDNLALLNADTESKKTFKFWQPITLADYKTVDSPYNTYLIDGLPPGPICNPGLKSIEASIDYSKHNYLYFLQNDGKIYPSETLEGHNKNRKEVLGVNK